MCGGLKREGGLFRILAPRGRLIREGAWGLKRAFGNVDVIKIACSGI